jgi:hypothetical protein
MRFSVVELYVAGSRRSRDEVKQAAPTLGELLISDWGSDNALCRALRVAHLKTRSVSVATDALMPLFDPAVIRMTSTGFVLRGFQLKPESGCLREETQEWWVRPSL